MASIEWHQYQLGIERVQAYTR